MSTPQVFTVTSGEMDALHGLGPLSIAIYLHLRQWMDYATGTVGRTRPISLAMLASYLEHHIPKGQGTQITRPSERNLRTGLDNLVRAGLLIRERATSLVFRLVLAQTGEVRPFQTGCEQGTDLSTEPGSVKATPSMGSSAEQGMSETHADVLNAAHIRLKEVQELYAVQPASPVDNFGAAIQPATPSGDCKPQRQSNRRLSLARGTEDDQARLLRCGRQRGLEPRPGESWAEFAARVFRPAAAYVIGAQDAAVSRVQAAQGDIASSPIPGHAQTAESRQNAGKWPEEVPA